MPEAEEWDVLIVGAGPAGLSAALVLGRCRRRVLLADSGTPRNRATKSMHSFLSRDGIAPDEFKRIAHDELARYDGVRFEPQAVADARADADGGFTATLADGSRFRARKLLLATGLYDELPALEGLPALYGTSVFHCPYCDGWEWRDAPLALYGKRQRAMDIARAMSAWSRDLVLCTDGPAGLSRADRGRLQQNRIELVEEPIARLDGRDGMLQAVVLRSGRRIDRKALFFDTPTRPQSSLAARLGCEFDSRGGIRSTRHEATSVPGVFVAGNILRDVQLAIVAAAEGCKAAFGINRALTREDFERRATGARQIEHPSLAEES
jgi:thioredoxin reductase